jgi:hypothetical protein
VSRWSVGGWLDRAGMRDEPHFDSRTRRALADENGGKARDSRRAVERRARQARMQDSKTGRRGRQR